MKIAIQKINRIANVTYRKKKIAIAHFRKRQHSFIGLNQIVEGNRFFLVS